MAAPDPVQASGFSTLRGHLRAMPAVRYLLLITLLLEGLCILVLPSLVPKHFYLRTYLEEAAEKQTLAFSHDQDPYLMWDSAAGWRNRPLAKNGHWDVDEFGSRSSEALSQAHGKKRRLVFLGSSMTNGGMHVSNQETVSAYASDSATECFNFATMAYSVDQALELYSTHARGFGADVVVLGLDDSPEAGLENRYVPFRRRDEVNMPYAKPRFMLSGDRLEFLPPPSRDTLASVLTSDEFLEELKGSDGFYDKFARFMRFGQLPVSATLCKGYERAQRAMQALASPDPHQYDLLLALLRKLSQEVDADGARFVVMTMPTFETVFPSRLRQYMPDRHEELVDLLQRSGFLVVDGREVLRQLDVPPRSLFTGDLVHYKPVANRAIAMALTNALPESRDTSSSPADTATAP